MISKLGFAAMDSRLSASMPYDAALYLLLSSSPTTTFTPEPSLPRKFLLQIHNWLYGVQSVLRGIAKSSILLAEDSRDLSRILQHVARRITDSLLSICGAAARMCYQTAYSLSRRHNALHSLFCKIRPDPSPRRDVQR